MRVLMSLAQGSDACLWWGSNSWQIDCK